MASHKFSVGDRVLVRPVPANWNVRPGIYTITRSLPETSAGVQYRAKSAMDEHERVFTEGQLERAS